MGKAGFLFFELDLAQYCDLSVCNLPFLLSEHDPLSLCVEFAADLLPEALGLFKKLIDCQVKLCNVIE
jgi:hypothetical protein